MLKVKIGDRIYDAKDQPIMLILEDYSKEHIRNMDKNNFKYCESPDGYTANEIFDFMEG